MYSRWTGGLQALSAWPADGAGVRCPTGSAVVTRNIGELDELFEAVVVVVAPFYTPCADRYEDQAHDPKAELLPASAQLEVVGPCTGVVAVLLFHRQCGWKVQPDPQRLRRCLSHGERRWYR